MTLDALALPQHDHPLRELEMMMQHLVSGALAAAFSCGVALAQNSPTAPNPDTFYKLGPDSLEQEGVPKGEMRGPFTLPSTVYPGTQHTYWVYVPAQYTSSEPASLMIFNDGQAFKNPTGNVRAHNVLDNLIFRREIPVMIAVFINPGRTPEQPEPTPQNWGDKDTNRPTEYNSLDDRYARVIVDELMPALEKDFNISKDPERRGIGGASSGAIAAFTVAWQRPDHLRKVLSIVGSFTNIRGGHAYPDLVLKAERKPIRVFLQDGRNDNRALSANGTYDQLAKAERDNARVEPGMEKPYGVPGDFAEHFKLMTDMITVAFRADLTRVVTFLVTREGTSRAYREIGIADGHHPLTHHRNVVEMMDKVALINRYHVEQFAKWIATLKAAEEGDRSVLDNSMIVYGAGLADGNTHTHHDLPTLIAGRAGGSIKSGRRVVYRRETPMCNLFLTMMDRMGTRTAHFGDSTGHLGGLDG